MEKPTNYFYQNLEKQNVLTEEDIDKYLDEHFQELIDGLIRRFAKVIIDYKSQSINE